MISKLTVFIISAIAIAVLDAKCTTEPIQTTTAALCLNCNGQVTGGKAVDQQLFHLKQQNKIYMLNI